VAVPVEDPGARRELAERRLELEEIELQLLLEGVYRHYGFDFREYAHASLKRRVGIRVRAEGVRTIAGLLEAVLHDPACMERLLQALSISVTAMFRDPPFFRAFRELVVPVLRTHPFARVWVAGCSTGEEVYALAILLAEAGLLDRTRIYATDINEVVLARAKQGVFPLDKMREYTDKYLRAGGERAFSDYYLARYDGALFDRSLVENVVWAQHNLVQDGVFNEFHAIVCRNVLIYFDRRLQHRVHRLFHDSLQRFGALCLGNRESLRLSGYEECYEQLDEEARLYRRTR
jgi:chemotaxis protein methyltransferase CheR